MTPIDDSLPFNLDAERSLLGAALLSHSAALEVLSLVTQSDFFMTQHCYIFRHIQKVCANGDIPGLVTVYESLLSARDVEAAGGFGYLTTVADGVAGIANLPGYAKIVRNKALLRRLAHTCNTLKQQALDQKCQPAALVESAVSQILSIADECPEGGAARPWKGVAAKALKELRGAVENPQHAKRISFGLSDLDEMLGGLRPGELVEIVAPTSNGKTLLAAQSAFRADRDGCKILFFSAEMSAEEVALREIAYQAKVKFHFVRRPEKLQPDEWRKLVESSEQECSIRFVDQDITPARIWAMAEAAKRTQGLDLVIVDYDQLVVEAGMNPDVPDDSIFRHQRNFILRAKQLARKLNITFVLLSQLRKLGAAVSKGAPPHLDDIWGDSSVRNTPQIILWVSRDFFTHNMDSAYQRKAHIYVLKARSGRTGVVPLEFDPDYLRFLDQPPSEKDSVEERA